MSNKDDILSLLAEGRVEEAEDAIRDMTRRPDSRYSYTLAQAS